MDSKERIFAALELKTPDRVPIFESSIAPNVIESIIGENNLLRFVEEVGLDGVSVTINYKRKFRTKNTYKDEFGITRKVDKTYDMPLNYPIKTIDDFKKFKWPDVFEQEKYKNIKKAAKYFGGSKAIIILLRDVFSFPRDLLGFENFLMSFYSDKELLKELIKQSAEYSLGLARESFKHGAEIILATDDYADNKGPLLNPDMMREFIFPALSNLFKEFKKIGFKVIKHTDGNVMPILNDLVECKIDCLDPVDPLADMNLKNIKKIIGNRVCLKGNVNCATTLVDGTISETIAETRKCLEDAKGKGGYILSSSNSIHSGVNPDNFLKMVETAKEYGAY